VARCECSICQPRRLRGDLLREFGADRDKEAQWRGFLRKNRLVNAPLDLSDATKSVVEFVGPILAGVRSGRTLAASWLPGGGWRF
jgi:hypothetical protein